MTTVPENIADISGLKVALEATKQLPDANLTEFYQSWATIWRQKTRPELEQLLLTIDAHAPNKVRVNVVAANTDDFYSTFDVKEGDVCTLLQRTEFRFGNIFGSLLIRQGVMPESLHGMLS
ncbi:M13-type metalloendopeptidase [Paenibacillus filicis]|uniref:M13-type metalloendopeptidase n=1 Tax=Paenibacillus filicis TaxID=669464 RepID=A0ABU9DEG7_9BACL